VEGVVPISMALVPDTPAIPGEHRVIDAWEKGAPGLHDFMLRYSGCSFAGGLYRVHAVSEIQKWTQLCVEGFSAFANRILCFSSDWMGNQFALDGKRRERGECQVLLFEGGTGHAMEIPATFRSLHEIELVNDQEALLFIGGFREWLSSGGAPPRRDQCVGYKIPPLLGGKQEDVTNLEIADMAVYWSISNQLATQTKGLSPATAIGGIKIK
jgi:hypothetical protein